MSSQCSRPPKIRSSCSANSGGGTPSVGIMREIAITGKSIQQSTLSVQASVSMVSQETSVANGSKNTTARSRACNSPQNSANAGLASSFLTEMSRFGYSVLNCSSESERPRSFSTNTSGRRVCRVFLKRFLATRYATLGSHHSRRTHTLKADGMTLLQQMHQRKSNETECSSMQWCRRRDIA